MLQADFVYVYVYVCGVVLRACICTFPQELQPCLLGSLEHLSCATACICSTYYPRTYFSEGALGHVVGVCQCPCGCVYIRICVMGCEQLWPAC